MDYKDDGILGVLRNNIEYNTDPPLFSLLLRIWSNFGNSIIWLRLLPSIFGFITLVYTYKILKKTGNYIWLTILLISISEQIVNYSQEIRAYSLGMFCATATSYILSNEYSNLKKYISDFKYINKKYKYLTIIASNVTDEIYHSIKEILDNEKIINHSTTKYIRHGDILIIRTNINFINMKANQSKT